jgi:hypothetical protein
MNTQKDTSCYDKLYGTIFFSKKKILSDFIDFENEFIKYKREKRIEKNKIYNII